MYKKLLALALVLVIALTAGAVLAQPQTQTPSGTIRITLNSASAGVGASWGQASLLFQGKAHRFRVSGLKVLSVGVRRIALRGDVYNLNNVRDFAGTFRNAPPGLTFISLISNEVRPVPCVCSRRLRCEYGKRRSSRDAPGAGSTVGVAPGAMPPVLCTHRPHCRRNRNRLSHL